MINVTHFKLTGSMIAAIAAMTPLGVHAQEAASSAQASDAGTSGDIVVTGLRRSEALTDSPVSVSVFSEEEIDNAGFKMPSDFLALTPNVNFTSSVNAGDFLVNIRGQASVRRAEPAVAIIVDGVKIGSPSEFNSAIFDLQQIEVLKGPQGAYYGRNASAGAIVISTKAPTEVFSGSASFSYGEDATYSAISSISGGIAPGLTARLSGSFTGTDGSYTNVNTGEKSQRFKEEAARLRLRFDDGGPFTADGRISVAHATGGAVPYTAKIGIASGLSPNGTYVHGIQVTDIDANNNIDLPFVTDVPGRYQRDVVSAGLRMEYDFGGFKLASISGYSHVDENSSGKNYPFNNPSDPLEDYGVWAVIFGDRTQNLVFSTEQFSQELQLTSETGGFLEWQAGFEFTHNSRDATYGNTLNGAVPSDMTAEELIGYVGYNAAGERTLIGGGNAIPFPVRIFGLDTAYPTVSFFTDRYIGINYAPYANAQFNLTDNLTLAVAGRYDIEKRKVKAIGPDVLNPFTGLSYNPCVNVTDLGADGCAKGLETTFEQFQPKVTLTYTFDGGSVYASWGRSFKSGGYNSIGTRATIVGSRVTLYQGQDPTLTDAQALALAEAAVITQDTYDKEVATTYEAGFHASLFDSRLRVNGAVFYTEVKNAQQYLFDPIAFIEAIQSIDKSEILGFELDAKAKVTNWLDLFGSVGLIDAEMTEVSANPAAEGGRPLYVPESTITVGASLDLPISADKSIIGRIDYTRTGRTEYHLLNDPDFSRDPYAVVNARLGIAGEGWSASLWAKNLFDEVYVNEISPITEGVATAYILTQRRTLGAEVKFEF